MTPITEFARLGVVKRNLNDWRIAKVGNVIQPYGHIKGLPSLYGKLLCTDGILCLVEQHNNTWFIGHLQYFQANKKTKETLEQQRKDKYK